MQDVSSRVLIFIVECIWALKVKYLTQFSQRFVTAIRKKWPENHLDTRWIMRSYRHLEKEAILLDPQNPGPSLAQRAKSAKTGTSLSASAYFTDSGLSNKKHKRVNYGEATNFPAWEVARAATAAPFNFPPLEVTLHPRTLSGKPNTVEFEDGGFSQANNPTMEGIEEVKELHGNEAVGVVVSIGTSRKRGARQGGAIGRALGAINDLTDPEPVHRHVEKLSEEQPRFQYFRLNNATDSALDIEFDDWRPSQSMGRRAIRKLMKNQFQNSKEPGSTTLQEMEHNFNAWTALNKNEKYLRNCAFALVRQRRRRIASCSDRGRWERFATGAHYYCAEINCECEFASRDQFVAHVCNDHLYIEQNMEEDQISEQYERIYECVTNSKRRSQWKYQESPETKGNGSGTK